MLYLSLWPSGVGCITEAHRAGPLHSYTVASLSPEPVTMYLSSSEMSHARIDEFSFHCEKRQI